jgi:hypothetical protein
MCQQHVDFVTVALPHMREHGFELMEPELEAEKNFELFLISKPKQIPVPDPTPPLLVNCRDCVWI